MERFVASQAMQTVAVLWKRGWAAADDNNKGGSGEEEKKKWLMELGELAASKTCSERILCARMLRAMVEEFCARNTSTRIDLPLAVHRKAKEAFEENGLLDSLRGGIILLKSAMNDLRVGIDSTTGHRHLSADVIELLSSSVQLVSSIFCWEFNFQEVWQHNDTSPLLAPGPTWRLFVTCPNLISSIFDVYNCSRSLIGGQQHSPVSNLMHNLQQLIVQLCSIPGAIFEDTKERWAYVSFLLERLSVLLAPTPVGKGGMVNSSFLSDALATTDDEEGKVRERISLALAARALLTNFHLRELSELPGFEACIANLSTLTISVLAAASHAASNGSDVSLNWHLETFSELLFCWVSMACDDDILKRKTDPEDYERAEKLRSGLSLVVLPLYDAYVQARRLISRVEGARAISSEEDGEVNEIEAADIDEELCQVATLGRLATRSSGGGLEIMIRSLASARAAAENLICTGMVDNQPGIDSTTGCPIAAASAVLEEARVCFLMACHLLADDDDSESPMIPESLMEPLSTNSESAQHVVSLLYMITGHLHWCTQHLLSGQNLLLLSPSLIQALLWCCARIARTYLLPDTEPYISTEEFGRGGGGGGPHENRWKIASILMTSCFQKGESATSLTNLLLCSAWTLLQSWSNEPDVCNGALDLLRTLVKPSTAPTLLSLPFWSEVADAAAAGKLSRLEKEMQGSILNAIIQGSLSGGGTVGTASRDRFFKLALPVSTKLQDAAVSIVNNPHGMIDGKVLHELEVCLEQVRGIVIGTDGSRYSSEIGDFVEAVIEPVIIILRISSNSLIDYEPLLLGCLVLLRDIANAQLIFMDIRRSQILCKASVEAVRIYSNSSRSQKQVSSQIQNSNSVPQSLHLTSFAEESYFAEMVVLYELLSYLIIKDAVNLSSSGSTDNNKTAVACGDIYSSVPDTALFGLSRLLSLMNDAMLTFPPLASQYFLFVGYVCETYPAHVLLNLKGDILSKLWSSLMFGATLESPSVARSSIGAMGGLASHQQPFGNHELIISNPSTTEAIAILLKLLAEDGPIWDRIDTVADTLLSLVLCNSTGMESVAQALVESQPAEHHQQLTTAFFQLMSHIDIREGSASRRNMRTFRKNVRIFVTTLRGLLICR